VKVSPKLILSLLITLILGQNRKLIIYDSLPRHQILQPADNCVGGGNPAALWAVEWPCAIDHGEQLMGLGASKTYSVRAGSPRIIRRQTSSQLFADVKVEISTTELLPRTT
jgi:hypothetical protein